MNLGIIVNQQELFLWPPNLAWQSLLFLLHYPVRLVSHIFNNFAHNYIIFQQLIEQSKPLTVGLFLDLVVWVFFALLVIVLPLIILVDTINDVGAHKRKHLFISDSLIVSGKLFFYYLLTAIFLFVLYNYFVPENLLFPPLN